MAYFALLWCMLGVFGRYEGRKTFIPTKHFSSQKVGGN